MDNKTGRRCSEALWKHFRSGSIPVIPDIKYRSPGEGELIAGRDPVRLAAGLEKAGAPMISVVTETEHYGGSPELLRKITYSSRVPVLRKDFIKTSEQLKETADMGAAGVLLIYSMLEKKRLTRLYYEALALGLEPLVETHGIDEINSVNELEPTLIGINNRDIAVWETDNGNVAITEKLASFIPSGPLLVSESSISTPDDIMRAAGAGANAVLVGTAILKAPDPVEMYRLLMGTAVKRIV